MHVLEAKALGLFSDLGETRKGLFAHAIGASAVELDRIQKIFAGVEGVPCGLYCVDQAEVVSRRCPKLNRVRFNVLALLKGQLHILGHFITNII